MTRGKKTLGSTRSTWPVLSKMRGIKLWRQGKKIRIPIRSKSTWIHKSWPKAGWTLSTPHKISLIQRLDTKNCTIWNILKIKRRPYHRYCSRTAKLRKGKIPAVHKRSNISLKISIVPSYTEWDVMKKTIFWINTLISKNTQISQISSSLVTLDECIIFFVFLIFFIIWILIFIQSLMFK